MGRFLKQIIKEKLQKSNILLFPHVQKVSDISPWEFKRYCLNRARKMRDTIKYQLGLLDAEYSGKDLPLFSVKGLE